MANIVRKEGVLFDVDATKYPSFWQRCHHERPGTGLKDGKR